MTDQFPVRTLITTPVQLMFYHQVSIEEGGVDLSQEWFDAFVTSLNPRLSLRVYPGDRVRVQVLQGLWKLQCTQDSRESTDYRNYAHAFTPWWQK